MVDPALGQINQAGDPNAIFLKVFSGEVFTAFKLNTVADALQRTRSIANGKSAQFPAVGWLNAYYHQPGVEILGQQGVQNEKVIYIIGAQKIQGEEEAGRSADAAKSDVALSAEYSGRYPRRRRIRPVLLKQWK